MVNCNFPYSQSVYSTRGKFHNKEGKKIYSAQDRDLSCSILEQQRAGRSEAGAEQRIRLGRIVLIKQRFLQSVQAVQLFVNGKLQ